MPVLDLGGEELGLGGEILELGESEVTTDYIGRFYQPAPAGETFPALNGSRVHSCASVRAFSPSSANSSIVKAGYYGFSGSTGTTEKSGTVYLYEAEEDPNRAGNFQPSGPILLQQALGPLPGEGLGVARVQEAVIDPPYLLDQAKTYIIVMAPNGGENGLALDLSEDPNTTGDPSRSYFVQTSQNPNPPATWDINTQNDTTNETDIALWFEVAVNDDPPSGVTLTNPYNPTDFRPFKGDSGVLNFNNGNWTGATSFEFYNLPSWCTQDGTTANVNYSNASWGTEGNSSDNKIGDGLWDIQVKAISSDGLMFGVSSVWLRVEL